MTSLVLYGVTLIASGAVVRYFFPWLDLLRVPLLCAAVFLVFPLLVRVDGIKAFAAGMFEVSRWDVFQITLSVFLTAAALLTCTDLIVSLGPQRVAGVPPLPAVLSTPAIVWPIELSRISAGFGALYFLGAIHYLIALRTVDRNPAGEILLGAAIFLASLVPLHFVANYPAFEEFVRWGVRLLATDAGYIDPATGLVYRSHVIATVLSSMAVSAYGAFGWIRFRAIRKNVPLSTEEAERGSSVPTLAWVVLLILLACWILSGLAFWMDARRIPLLIPLGLLLGLCAYFFPRSDHVFPVREGSVNGPTPREILANEESIIVVAASGGGIQAAAWTATITEELTKAIPGFAQHVRLLSGVSGGSVGLMYFASAYDNGDIDPKDLEQRVPGGENPLFRLASAPSLDYAAWGFAFPDFFRSWLPVLFPQHIDRRWALVRAWTRYRGMESLGHVYLSDWARDTGQGIRPAVSFNATIAETGARYLFSTFRLEKPLFGRKEISSYPGNRDLKVANAVSLSAAFPYVSPASRPELDGCPGGGPCGHVVDGGYYDNYGIATAVDFLTEGLPSAEGKKVFLLHIEAGEFGEKSVQKRQRGWFFQLLAPPKGLLGVWDTGMRSRNIVEIGLLKEVIEKRGGKFVSLRVDFPKPETPTSWYLTRGDKQAIRDGWRDRGPATIAAVKAFLRQN